MQISWTIEGEKQLSRSLRGLRTGLTDFTDPFTKAANKLKRTFGGEVFSTEGSAIDAAKWARLSPYTVAQKAREGYGSKGILERTGAMKRGFKTLISSNEAVIYNVEDYFKYHQSNQARNGKLPRRVMMALGNNQKEMVVKEFQKYLLKLGS